MLENKTDAEHVTRSEPPGGRSSRDVTAWWTEPCKAAGSTLDAPGTAWYYLPAANDELEAPRVDDTTGAAQATSQPSGDEIVGGHSREWIGLLLCPRMHTMTTERAVGHGPGGARKTE